MSPPAPDTPASPSAASRSEGSRRRILRAAVREFADRGLAGARMEAIAKAAKLNKALVYRHFKTKERLFHEALESKFAARYRSAHGMPRPLAEAMVFWFERAAEDRELLVLLQREAINPDAPTAHEELRRAYYDAQVDDVQARMQAGQIDARFDPRMVYLAMIALVSFPSFFPRMTALITGHAPDDAAFKQQWAALLRELAQRLAAAPSAGAGAPDSGNLDPGDLDPGDLDSGDLDSGE